MNKTVYWVMILACLIIIGFLSRQPSQEQDIRPIINRYKPLIEFVQEMPQVRFPYAGRIVDSWENPADFIQFIIRKLFHFTFYGFFGVLLIMATGGFYELKAIRWILAGVFLGAVAAGDELNQFYTPGRTGCIEDVIVDMLGYLVISSVIMVGVEFIRFSTPRRYL
ncbi:MAG: VanZ family protein [Syntrophomonadaceae bacterium]|nr:VanZ family protein [Syntrophomonadaceae bacterium]